MSELGDRMAAIAAAFAALYPARKVRRNFIDFDQLPDADLQAGVYTLLSQGEGELTNLPGYSARDGAQSIALIGQIRLSVDATGSQIEDAEFTLVEEVKAFCASASGALGLLSLLSWRQSGQVEAPYGWIACSLEYRP